MRSLTSLVAVLVVVPWPPFDREALVTYYYQPKGVGGASGIRLKRFPLEWFARPAAP